jgi:phospholipid/cholesterol/gamma-HCH transport system permease protein
MREREIRTRAGASPAALDVRDGQRRQSGAFAPRLPDSVLEVGAMFWLFASVIRRSLQPPLNYGAELVEQFRFVLAVAWFPMILTSFAISFGPAGIQASDFLGLFGALDRLGSLYGTFVPREFGPLVVSIVAAGTAGTAICADLGARKVRDELDALAVLGVDVVKSLVVPRFLALLSISVLFNTFALAAGMFGAVLVEIENHQPLGPFFASFFAAASTVELAASYVKCLVFGGMIAIVCCYKGVNASGGAEGVGRAVNQAIVMAFLAIGAIDYVFTQLLLATHPVLSQVR